MTGTVHAVARDLTRSAPFRFRAAAEPDDGDGRTLSGYAAVFGRDTEIDSWEGTFTETIRKGAFRKTIRESTPVMQFDHGHHPLIGSIPIGAIEDLREDDEGLYVQARLSENWLIEPVREAIANQTVTGMSFRFEVVRDEWRDAAGKLVKPEELMDLLWMPGDRGPLRRELVELKCRELGPVVFPAYAGTSVSVRARGMADELARSGDMTRQIRQSLARDAAAPTVPDDPDLRREVATSLLFGRPGDITRGEHLVVDLSPATDPEKLADTVRDTLRRVRQNAAPPTPGHPAHQTTTQGAPLEREHPPAPGTSDAPPSDGHPSTPDTTRSALLREQIREIAGLMADKLAPIAEDN
ncbi:phage prohead protein [Streptomyces amritsarensis]|uniref:Phage prohead protein n=1 Tax=Streptomyces amritsarensis TaxID=681158 RepID=A0ABX3GBW7_9ACTN|nr:HK97 family phage prohead protease [Streptomyces amritsarensis]OLZ72565.1 phage prohead protein [Streptomyces amritsarensis]